MARFFNVFTWKWGKKYSADYVNKLYGMLKRNCPAEIIPRLICITEDDKGLREEVLYLPLEMLPVKHLLTLEDGCWARLVVFSRDFASICRQAGILIADDDRITVMDLDVVIVGSMYGIAMREEKFIIAHGIHYLATPFNGSMIQLKLGSYPHVWEDFSVMEASRYLRIDDVYQSTDQSWLYQRMRGRAGQFTPRGSGVYGYGKPGWPKDRTELPENCRVVFFPGSRDPADPELQEKMPWIKEHWRE